MSLRRMDSATAEDWLLIKEEIGGLRRGMPERIKRMVLGLRELEAGGFAVDQLTHCLQTATYAERDGASEEIVLAALLHDAGKVVSPENHGAIIAEVLKPVVSADTYWLLQNHQVFQGRYFYRHLGLNVDEYKKYADHPAFDLAIRFSDWDQAAFDPAYDTLPFEHFEPLIAEFWVKKRGFG